MHFLRKLEVVTDIAAFIGILIVVPLILSMVYEVLSRYLLSAPTFWAYELGYMMMGAIFMFGMAYALKVRQHVTVDVLHGALPPRLKAAVNILGYCFFIPCVAWLTYALWGYMMRAYIGGEGSGQSAWNPHIWPYRAILVIGFAIFLLQTLIEFAKNWIALIANDATDI